MVDPPHESRKAEHVKEVSRTLRLEASKKSCVPRRTQVLAAFVAQDFLSTRKFEWASPCKDTKHNLDKFRRQIFGYRMFEFLI